MGPNSKMLILSITSACIRSKDLIWMHERDFRRISAQNNIEYEEKRFMFWIFFHILWFFFRVYQILQGLSFEQAFMKAKIYLAHRNIRNIASCGSAATKYYGMSVCVGPTYSSHWNTHRWRKTASWRSVAYFYVMDRMQTMLYR